jgi:stearoyl-CoA desaturase (delta-9 desaturase)
MAQVVWCGLAFTVGFLLNIFYITVLYHRGLAHGAVVLSPRVRRFVGITGNWVTGLDAKAWACMHRLHHRHSDTPNDPHSPSNGGIFSVFRSQLKSYESILGQLLRRDPAIGAVVGDIDIPVHWLNRKRLWWLPYVVHLAIVVVIGVVFHAWLVGYFFFAGLMSHPVQGWMVNSFGHRIEYRNFELPDDSRNNTFVAWTVMGEGYQNNHHRYPRSARFSARWWEVDPGYGLCRVGELFGVLRINRQTLLPRRSESAPFELPQPPRGDALGEW